MSAPTGRAEVRDLVAAIVAAAVQPLGGVVYRARTYPLQLDQLPAILVYGWEETKKNPGISSPDVRMDVTCQMVVQAYAQADTPELVEAALEDLAGAIVGSVITAPGLVDAGGAIERIASVKTTIQVPRPTGETVAGEVSVTFEMEWSEMFDVPLPIGSGGTYCTEVDFVFTQTAIPSTDS